uniref:hypothetical protein n=1 Tax=Ruminococcus bromii TaxID=40518 RepID=UPI003FEFDDF5
MKKLFNKTSIRFLVAVLVFVTLALLSWEIISTGLIAYAGDNDLKFDNTSIFDDLYRSKDDNGNEFDLSNYPIDKDGELQFFSFVEYGYSYYANYEKNYALYLYLYNPQQLNFQTYLDSNVVRMGVSYTTKDDNIVVSEYEDFNIVCVSRTTGDYSNLFYKFKVLDPNKKILTMAQAYEKENGCRRYDIAGVYLKTDKSDVTLDKNIGRTYKCSGYMATYGKDASNPSTFVCNVEKLETLDLKVYQTSYLTGVSSAGAYHHNNVSSVYFAIPQRVLDKYGSLWEIYAQWYECKTAPIFVTSNSNLYNGMKDLTHYSLSENKNKPRFDDSVPYYFYYGMDSNEGLGQVHSRTTYDWAYNLYSYEEDYPSSSTHVTVSNSALNLPYVFYSPSYTVNGAFNVINKQTVAGDVTSSQIRDYIQNYKSSNYVDWHTSRNLASELFVNTVDSARANKGIKVGLNKVRTNLGDTFDLKSWNSEYGSWWDKLTQYGWSYPKNEVLDEQHTNVKPFEEVINTTLNSVTLSSDLLINENDVDSFKTFCNSSYANDEVPYLFRFAVSDYYSRPLGYGDSQNKVYKTEKESDTYLAQETVFFDFNIITMTFKGKDDYYTLAVMHTPVDVIAGVEPPPVELTPGEHLINNFLTAMQKIWDWFKNSDFLKALKILGLIIVGIIVALILIKIIAFIVKCVSKRKNNHTVDYKAIKTPVPRDKSKCVRSAKAKSATSSSSRTKKYKYRR